jgi:hypothetical protein
MNKNTRRKLAELRKKDKSYFRHRPRVRSGGKGKVACLTYKSHERLNNNSDES